MAKDPTPKQLELFAKAQSAFLDRVSTSVTNEFSQVLKRYTNEFYTAVNKSDYSEDTVLRLAQTRRLTADLYNFLEAAGVKDALARYQSNYRDITKNALEYFTLIEEPATLAGVNVESLEFLANENTARLYDELDNRWIKPLNNALIQNTFLQRNRVDVISELSGIATDLKMHQVEVLVSDTYQRFHRVVRDEKGVALGLSDYVLFVNPVDRRTSKQCLFMTRYFKHGVKGLWKRKDFTQANINRQLGKPLLKESPLRAGGHWGCRGEHYPYSTEGARLLGAKI